MEDLIFLVRRRMIKPIECRQRNYDEGMNALCDRMLVIQPEQRIPISEIIKHPLLVVRIYKNYFDYENKYNSG